MTDTIHKIHEEIAHLAIPITEPRPYPHNPRRGDINTIVESLEHNGQYRPIVVNRRTNEILAGNHTWQAAKALGWERIAATYVDADEQQAARIVAVDNRANDLAGYDDEQLAALLADLPDLAGTGYAPEDLDELLAALNPDNTTDGLSPVSLTDPDATPELPAEPVTKLGDLWLLGPHRVMCGDSTNLDHIRNAADGVAPITLIHADPPYGMGKEADGVLNDNLYGPELDRFQMAWWDAWQHTLTPNGSAYIWGNAPDLWRLWWTGGLGAREDLTVRNEIVWNKGSAPGMRSKAGHSYTTISERCLFLMRGQQFLGNVNTADFWEGYEPLLTWLTDQRDQAGWTNRDINQLTGTQMAGHWFTRSQFAPISAKHYNTLQQAAAGRAFTKNYDDLFAEMFPNVRQGGNEHRRDLNAQLREIRSYFDNTHEAMGDVWDYPRVTGADRHGHATPKPVAMIERAIKTSSNPGDTIGIPFGGSGPDVIAAHRTERVAVVLELEPRYVDVICRRYQQHTGVKPVLASTGQEHDFDANP